MPLRSPIEPLPEGDGEGPDPFARFPDEADGCTKCGHPDTVIVTCPVCNVEYVGGTHFSGCSRTAEAVRHAGGLCRGGG